MSAPEPLEPESRGPMVVAVCLGIVMTLGDVTALTMQKQEARERRQQQTQAEPAWAPPAVGAASLIPRGAATASRRAPR